jgi:PAS domain-containing protein
LETEDISRLLLTSLLSIAAEAIISVDQVHNITLFNHRAENTFGYRRDEVLGQPSISCYPSRFGLLTPIVFSNLARRLKPLGSRVIEGKLFAGVAMGGNSRDSGNLQDHNWRSAHLLRFVA